MPKKWEELGVQLHEQVTEAIKSLNFPTMTPVQAATIPHLLSNKDVVAEAVTGSGKTLAFLIPMLQILKQREAEESWKKHQIGALIVSPTRELALQIKEVLDSLLEHVTGLKQVVLIGGTTVENDLSNFKQLGANIIVCTPGRFEDLLSRKSDINFTFALKSLEILVLDEADRLLDLGFRNSINAILSYLPKQRRTGLFSATQTKQVQDLIRAGLRNPVLISVSAKAQQNTPELLNNYYVIVKDGGKLATLLSFLEAKKVQKGLLFLPTCACVDYWSKVFPQLVRKLSFPVLAIHGKLKQKRHKILERFRGLSKALLLCTDVMARGIDIPEVDWVIQWDPPTKAAAFVHRVGRTARQGRTGSSLILLLENEASYVHFIEKNQKVKLEQIEDLATEEQATSHRETIHTIMRQDRDVMEKGTQAFVSHVRAYSKHECSLLLKVKELPLGAMAATYGLLQLPRMPELRNRDLSNFPAISDFDVNSVPYKDKQKETVRQQKLDVYKSTGSWPSKKNFVKKSSESWSIAKEKRQEHKDRKLKRKSKKEKMTGPVKKKKKISEEDLEELARDIALLKKFKRKKISEEEYDREIGLE